MFCPEFGNLAANKALRKLGIKDESKVLTYDGNPDGKETFAFEDMNFVRIGGTIDTDTVVSVSLNDTAIPASELEFSSIEDVAVIIYADTPGVWVLADNNKYGVPSGTYVLSEDGFIITRIETETIHPIDQKYLPDNVVDCDKLTCTLADGSVSSFSDVVYALFVSSITGGDSTQKLKVTDTNGAFRQAVSGKQSITIKQTTPLAVLNYPATVSRQNGEVVQLSGSAVLFIGQIGYCEIKYNIQMVTGSYDVNLMVKGTLISV